MPRISDKNRYPVDPEVSLDDYVIGSDAENNNSTKNYKLSSLYNTFKTSLGVSSIEYTFSDSVASGYFITNNIPDSIVQATQVDDIFYLEFHTNDQAGTDISPLFDVIADQPSSFTIKLAKSSSIGEVFYFVVSNVVDNGDGSYRLSVSNFVGANEFTYGTTYGISFDISGVPSVYSEEDPIFSASAAAGIDSTDIAQWNTAYNWGDHSTEGYLVSADINTLSELNAIVSDATLITDAPSDGSQYARQNGAWAVVSGGGGISEVAWGDITGTLSSQTDLNSALNSKLNLTGGTLTGQLNVTTSTPQIRLRGTSAGSSNTSSLVFQDSAAIIQGTVGFTSNANNNLSITNNLTSESLYLSGSDGLFYDNGTVNTVWHSGNDGHGNGLDADTLDGLEASAFAQLSGATFTGEVVVNAITDVNILSFSPSIVTSDANLINTWLPRTNSLLVKEQSGATNYPSPNGQHLTIRGSSDTRTFSFWRTSNTNTLHYGTWNGTAWTWNEVVHEGMSPDFGVTNTVTAGNFVLSSDRRLKSEISDIEVKYPVSWKQFKMNNELRYGVIADEVEEIYPELVYEGVDGYKKVAYVDLLVLENARLNKEIEDLRKDIDIIKEILK
jgi:hypothetical protein